MTTQADIDWVAIFDVDEFWYSPLFGTVANTLVEMLLLLLHVGRAWANNKSIPIWPFVADHVYTPL